MRTNGGDDARDDGARVLRLLNMTRTFAVSGLLAVAWTSHLSSSCVSLARVEMYLATATLFAADVARHSSTRRRRSVVKRSKIAGRYRYHLSPCDRVFAGLERVDESPGSR